jgi:hypothetical protein
VDVECGLPDDIAEFLNCTHRVAFHWDWVSLPQKSAKNTKSE